MNIENLSRRNFLQGTGGVCLTLAIGCTAKSTSIQNADVSPQWTPNMWLTIEGTNGALGRLVITAHRSEMGQGVRTCLPAIIADEMGADWARVHVVQADADARFGSQSTDGSRSVRNSYENMRTLGTVARMMLQRAAAKTWGVPPGECSTENHRVFHVRTKRSLDFSQLTNAAALLPVPVPEPADRRPDSALRTVGTSFAMQDMHDITTGSAVYGQDIHMEGMRFAVIARPPVYGGKAKTWDKKAALAIPGVLAVLKLPVAAAPSGMNPLGGIAVVGTSTWAAMRGREALNIQWNDGKNAAHDSTAFSTSLKKTAQSPQKVVRRQGHVHAALRAGVRTVHADYALPYLAHAPMETPCATAKPLPEGGVEIWAPTQTPQSAQKQVAKTLSLDLHQVKVHVTLLGGGFGRKSKPDFVAEAGWLALKYGGAVKLMWTREDELRHGYYHAMSHQCLEGAINPKTGVTTAWLQRTVFPPIGSTFGPKRDAASELGLGFVDNAFSIPHMQLENGPAEGHVRIGWYRSVGNIQHAFASGCFADELAYLAGRDPKDYLLQLIGPPRRVNLTESGVAYSNYGASLDTHPIDTGRLRGVVETVSQSARWGTVLPVGHARGIAVHRSFLAYVAAVVEVSVHKTGRVIVPRVFMAIDAGVIINPDRVRAQLEGAAVMALSNALYGRIDVKNGRVVQGNFTDYKVLRMHEAPHVLVSIVDSTAPPAGVGEPGVPPVAPALCNAIFAATHVRKRQLPIYT